VVGAFYLTGVLGLNTASAGLVMTIGPAVSAIVGLPAGRLVDRNGAYATTYAGLFALLAGTVGMMVLPGVIGLAGYICSVILITSGYALFQAANNTALMAGAQKDQRGVTSALLALGRNVGLITGASAMGALFTFASGGSVAGGQFGLEVVYAAASVFAVLALALSAWTARSTGTDSK
jgi:MFS family permease